MDPPYFPGNFNNEYNINIEINQVKYKCIYYKGDIVISVSGDKSIPQ